MNGIKFLSVMENVKNVEILLTNFSHFFTNDQKARITNRIEKLIEKINQ